MPLIIPRESQCLVQYITTYHHSGQDPGVPRLLLRTATIRDTHLQIGVGASCMSGLEPSICLGINLENNFDEPGPGAKVFTMQRARDGVYEG